MFLKLAYLPSKLRSSGKFPRGTYQQIVASWLVRPAPELATRVRALAEDIVLCSWALYSHGTSLHPSVQKGTGEFNTGGNPGMD